MSSIANRQLNVGWAQTDITPDRPVYLLGQFYERISHYIHDPVTATALVLENGEDQAILISLDMAIVPVVVLNKVRGQLAAEPGLDVDKISMNMTHTHTSLCIGENGMISMYENVFGTDSVARLEKPDRLIEGEELIEFLSDKIVELIRNAWRARKPGGISYSLDYAAVAFNRRPVFDNGETIMYGVCSRNDFLRLEGASDHTADMLYTWDGSGNLTGVVVDIPCPSQVMELHSFISADYWDPARSAIREKLGCIFILPICGAGGDQNPLDLIRISRTNAVALAAWGGQTGEVFRDFDMALECRDIGDRIAEAVVRGFRKARNRIQTDAVLKHKVLILDLPIRMVSISEYNQALVEIETAKRIFSPLKKLQTADMVPLYKSVGTVLRWVQQQEKTTFTFEMHVLRLGNAAIATNPFELFTEYGMRIKARSPAEQIFLAQLANQDGGYLPTRAAISGGSYSSTAASTTCGPDGGDLLVEETLRAMMELWRHD